MKDESLLYKLIGLTCDLLIEAMPCFVGTMVAFAVAHWLGWWTI